MSDYLMRVVQRLRSGRRSLQPALRSRFEPAKTNPGSQAIRREADEPFAGVDDKGGHDSSATRLIPHDLGRQTSLSMDDTLNQREDGGATALVAAQAPRPIRDPEELLVETLVERNLLLPEHPANYRPLGTKDILEGTAIVRDNSPFPTVRRSRIEPKEERATEGPVTPVRSTEREQFVLSPSRRRQIAPEDQSLRSQTALKPSQPVQPRLEGSKLESETDSRPADHELQHQRDAPANFLTSKPAVRRGKLLPSSASFVHRTQNEERDETHDPSVFASPEIRVTIGRIEVRAVTPPGVSQGPPAKRTPKISLDDYLRSRNGTA
jgi:hypothetical protein